jgi:DNA polymerase-3 subunit delta'
MTVQAQNSLLKILEEPPHNTYFLITSAHPDQILITVRSRCRPVKLIPWPEDYIRQILSDSGIDPEMAAKSASVAFGSIGTAFRLASDDIYWRIREEILDTFFRNRRRSEILKISAGWKDRKSEAESVFSILEEELQKLFRYHLNPDGNQDISQFPDPWQKFAAYASKESFLNLMEKIKDARKQHAFNVNFQTIIEQLILIFLGESDLWAN